MKTNRQNTDHKHWNGCPYALRRGLGTWEVTYEGRRKNPWRSRDCAQKCVRAIAMAIKRLHCNLARAVDAEGKPHPILQDFARHLWKHLIVPSGRGGGQGGVRGFAGGCFTYEPPPGVLWRRE